MASLLFYDQLVPNDGDQSKRSQQQGAAERSRLQSTTQPYAYYLSCYMAGATSSSIRWLLSPLELVKVKMQVDSARYPNVRTATARIVEQTGYSGLFKGVGPTAVAYVLQTGTKYGTYEALKDISRHNMSEENFEKYKGLIYVTAAASAEAIADVLMCPFEMIKVKVQSSPPGTFPTTTGAAFVEMMKHRRDFQFPFGSLGPLWARQIPGTIVNFYTFENIVHALYSHVLTEKPKEEYSTATQLGVTVVSGYMAGFISAVVSHPADSLISLKSQTRYQNQSLMNIAKDFGFWNLATKGLVPRSLVLGKIICFQWLIYDSIKSALGYGTTGG